MSAWLPTFFRGWIALVFAAAGLCAQLAGAAEVDGGEVVFHNGFAVIKITFKKPIDIESYSPSSKGEELTVHIKRLRKDKGKGSAQTDEEGLGNWKFVSGELSTNPLYDSIHFEAADKDSGNLTIRFKKPMEYNVHRDSLLRSVMISVLTMDRSMKDTVVRQIKRTPAVLPLLSMPATLMAMGGTAASAGSKLKDASKAKPAAKTSKTKTVAANSAANQSSQSGTSTTKSSQTNTGNNKQPATGTGKRTQAIVQTQQKPAPKDVKIFSVDTPGGSIDQALPPEQDGSIPVDELEIPRALIASDDPADTMEAARRAVAGSNYRLAIELYNKVLQMPDNEYSQQALEFMGVVRERNGQLAQAKAIYETYLDRYTNEEDVIRVQQRLTGLLTQTQDPQVASRQSAKKKSLEPEWSSFGGIAQYYRYNDLTINDDQNTREEETERIESAITSDFYLAARRRSENWDIRARVTGGYINDFLEDSSGDEARLADLYVDVRHEKTDRSVRVGRQSSNTGGVLGRFDGGLARWPLNDNLRLNLVAGYPVLRTADVDVENDRYFYGANVDITPADSSWAYNVFLIEQRSEGLLDRRSVGGEVRYFEPGRSLFTLLDYDIFYQDLNTFLLVGNWITETNTTYTLTVDYRNSPILTTTNALQGQSTTRLDELLENFTEEELQEIARDRTATSTLVNFGISRPLTNDLQLFTNLSMTSFSDLPASAGVEALEGTGNEYSFDMQLISNNLMFSGDTHIFSARYFAGDTNNRSSLGFDGRYPITGKLRINPRFRADLRKGTDDDTEQWVLRPSVRLDYRWTRRTRLEFELGTEWSTRELEEIEEETRGLFGNLGYRVDF